MKVALLRLHGTCARSGRTFVSVRNLKKVCVWGGDLKKNFHRMNNTNMTAAAELSCIHG